MTKNIYTENQDWRGKISNHHQLGGIELAVLENGQGRGVRTAWFDTGTGLRFKKSQLPWVTNWQHWGRNEYITGLEPGTNPTIGQARAREDGTLIFLEPGEKRVYDLTLEII